MNLPWSVFYLIILSVLTGLSGCATLNKDECQYADWYTIGFGDGTKGYIAGQIDKHRKACAEYGIKPDIHSYNKGRDSGLLEYCRPGTGYEKGISGNTYYNVCPANLESEFLDAYNYGKKIYSLNARRKKNYQRLQNAHARLQDIYHKIEQKEARLVSDNASKQRRISLLDEIKLLTEEKRELENQIITLESREHKIDHKIKKLMKNSPY